MAYAEHDGGSSAAIVAIFAIVLIVLLLVLLFSVHPFHMFGPTVVSPASTGGGTMHATASSMPSVVASPSMSP